MLRYERTVYPPRGIRWAFWGIFAGCVALSVLLWVLQTEPWWARLVATGLLLGLTGPLARCRGVVTVDDNALRLRAPFVRKTIRLTDVVSAEPTHTNPWRDFSGFGYRFLGGGLVGFVFETGPAARVATRGGRTYVITVPDADRLVAVLRAPAS